MEAGSGKQTAEQAIAKDEEIFNGLDNIWLNIAVAGETGVGKSSFVNAIRGVARDDEGWAPTGVTETTMEAKEYAHPYMPNVKIWDLPGIGSPSFDAKNYLHFEKYDFFIIVSASRFKENDLKLANEIKNKKKNFYFLRSKIDDDVKNESKDGGDTEEKILLKIRKYCKDNLSKLGAPPVFLITSNDLTKYDFPALLETLKSDIPREKTEALKQSLSEHSMQQARAKANKILNALDEVVLHIAITGESGTGKSSFVNAIRGIRRGEEGWAPTGVTETTMEPKEYAHPTMPNVNIWDLPGIGTISLDANNYVKKVHFEKYDFFIIVSASRFTENDLKLANEIKKNKKNFYFVRSKIDHDVRNEREDGGGTEEDILLKIRRDCLRKLGAPPVFLITSNDLTKYDFPALVEILKRDLPNEKRNALEKSLPVYSIQSLNDKYNTFKKSVWALAVVSAGIGAAPVPGLSFACDTAMVMSFLTAVYHSFGLDDKALERLSKRVNKSILEEVKKSELIQGIGKSMLTSSMLTKLAIAGGVEAVSCLIPIAGNIVAAGVSFVTTREVLQQGLDELYQVAKKVLEMANLQ